eukprot:CAMPEP_0173447916 /NCGR_PEP_ID=MMETSP1357-20121228/39682_1 /TAXON_ID=77926 /ORGANISM="Hemiselmis rufescens, Strain PCC563" /LENGTH=57 /DNA_ID=CAMNT_0014414351 /DNA_START=59 /DNA_END=229 /DNA_ORIENTATION=-
MYLSHAAEHTQHLPSTSPSDLPFFFFLTTPPVPLGSSTPQASLLSNTLFFPAQKPPS